MPYLVWIWYVLVMDAIIDMEEWTFIPWDRGGGSCLLSSWEEDALINSGSADREWVVRKAVGQLANDACDRHQSFLTNFCQCHCGKAFSYYLWAYFIPLVYSRLLKDEDSLYSLRHGRVSCPRGWWINITKLIRIAPCQLMRSFLTFSIESKFFKIKLFVWILTPS